MDTNAVLALISNLYAQLAAAQERIVELEKALTPEKD